MEADIIAHTFELAGLGKAPFRLVAVEIKKHPNGDGIFKAGGTCDYCSNAIMECCVIQGSDGKRFKVGNSCVKKTGDFGLVNTTQRAINRLKRQAQSERDALFVAEYDNAMRAHLATITGTHPNEYYANQGKTLGDYLLFQYENSGTGGKAKLIRKQGIK